MFSMLECQDMLGHLSSVREEVIVSQYKVMEFNWLEFYCLSCVLVGSVRLWVVPALEGHLTRWTSPPVNQSLPVPYIPHLTAFVAYTLAKEIPSLAFEVPTSTSAAHLVGTRANREHSAIQ